MKTDPLSLKSSINIPVTGIVLSRNKSDFANL